MKRLIKKVCVLAALCVVFGGCQMTKEGNTAYVEEEKNEMNRVSGEALEEIKNVQEETKELVPDGYVKYEPVVGWKDLDKDDYGVQIDDTLYVLGSTAEQFFSMVEASESEYAYEFNGKRLVDSKEIVHILIYRDGKAWFSVEMMNPSENVKELCELPVVAVIPNEDAFEYSYYFDGRSYDEFMQMSYSDVMRFGEENFSNSVMKSSTEVDGTATIHVKMGKAKEIRWKDYTIHSVAEGYSFYVDKEKNKVIFFGFNLNTKKIVSKYTPYPIVSFEELTEEEYNRLLAIAEKQFKEKAYKTYEIEGIYITERKKTTDNKTGESGFMAVAYLNGTNKYHACIITQLGRNDEGIMTMGETTYIQTMIDYSGSKMKSIIEEMTVLDTLKELSIKGV